MTEQDKIVAWLRGQVAERIAKADTEVSEDRRHARLYQAGAYTMAADAIERGDHLKPTATLSPDQWVKEPSAQMMHERLEGE